MGSAAGLTTKARMSDAAVLVQEELRCTESPAPAPAPRASSMDEAQDLQLIQMRYDEYLAHEALQRLFESGQLEFLSV